MTNDQAQKKLDEIFDDQTTQWRLRREKALADLKRNNEMSVAFKVKKSRHPGPGKRGCSAIDRILNDLLK